MIPDKDSLIRKQYTLRQIPAGKKILEIGCDYGFMSLEISQKSLFSVHGDISASFCYFTKKRNRNLNIVRCDIHNLPFRNHVFDYVVCTEVLEHVKSPFRTMKEMKRVCNGIILVSMPNPYDIQTLINLLVRIRPVYLGADHISSLRDHEFSKICEYLDLKWEKLPYYIKLPLLGFVFEKRVPVLYKKYAQYNFYKVYAK